MDSLDLNHRDETALEEEEDHLQWALRHRFEPLRQKQRLERGLDGSWPTPNDFRSAVRKEKKRPETFTSHLS